MLPDKNKLNDKTTEQIDGGLLDCMSGLSDSNENVPIYTVGFFACPCCGNIYAAYRKRTDGHCPNCDPMSLEASIPNGDIQTTIPIPSDKKKLINVH